MAESQTSQCHVSVQQTILNMGAYLLLAWHSLTFLNVAVWHGLMINCK